MTYLRAEKLSRDYLSGTKTLHVLQSVDLDIKEGEIVSIVGPSGSGKSTLLHLLGFLDRPTEGNVVFRGESLAGMEPGRQARVRNRSFGFVFQMYHLLPGLSAFENALLPLMIRHGILSWIGNRAAARRSVRELLESLGLGERMHHRPHQLSGGERQRVALARAPAGDPEVVFCDEPTGNLDAATSREIQELIVDLSARTKKTFVIVTHDENVASLAHRRFHLADGVLTA